MKFIRANRIHNGYQFLDENTIIVLNEDHHILDLIHASQIDPGTVQVFDGILCPGFVNAHCHLELSHMIGKIPEHTGLVDFALQIMKQRNSHTPEEIAAYAGQADKVMTAEGIVGVGDICNTAHTLEIKAGSGIAYHSFIELIGLNPERAESIFGEGTKLMSQYTNQGLRASLAPHAPYSVSARLMQLIASQKTITTIHNQESQEENTFFEHKQGRFLDLYQSIGVPIDYFTPSGKTSLQTYLEFLAGAQHILLVHNTLSSHEDMNAAATSRLPVSWCLCPNANLYIEKKLPNIPLLYESGIPVCLGTDSLASNHRLSVVSEINTILQHYPKIPLSAVLSWATYHGARALGLDAKLGTIEKNKAPGINHLVQQSEGFSVEKVC